MESIQQNCNNGDFEEHASNSPPGSPDICDVVGPPQLNPRVGGEYQVEVPSMIEESERLQLRMNPADSDVVMHDNLLSFAIGLPISVTWMHNEVEDRGHEGYLAGIVGDKSSDQLGKSKNYVLAPGTLSNSWSEADAKSFLLGLYIFGKNFVKINKFIENKGLGEILSFYYSKFYKSDEYCRWSECRKIKGRKCIMGQKLFTGQRQHELLSRLIPRVSEESQDTLLKISQSYVEGTTSLEEYISSMKSTVGLDLLVEAVAIGKEKEDLTSLAVELGKNNRVFSTSTCVAWSSLEPSDIIKHLTGMGGLRLSKAKSNDLFWEAVWPRLLARGWHSEQPKYQSYVRSQDYLVFLIPGVKNFSRRKLVKGEHYFDSVTDVLSKVAAEPSLLELGEEIKVGSENDEELEKGLSKDDQHHRQCYLKPRAPNTDHIKFLVIDTSLVQGGKSSDLMEFKSIPVKPVGKVKANTAGVTSKSFKHAGSVNVSENVDKKLMKFTVVDTSMLYEGKLLVREQKCLPVEMMTVLSRESKDSSSIQHSPNMVGVHMPDKNNISNGGSQNDISDHDAVNKKEPCGKLDNNENKTVGSQKNQKTCVSDDNPPKKTIKHQFSRRARTANCNDTVPPVKRRRLTACAKAEISRVNENSLGVLESEKLASAQPSSFPESLQHIGDLVSHQPNGSLIASSADRRVEVNSKEIILNEVGQCMSNSGVEVVKCESQSVVTFNTPQVPLKSKDGEMMVTVEENGKHIKENDPFLSTDMQGEVEKPQNPSSDVSSVEQKPDTIPRRQSTRNRPLSVKALESLGNEFLQVQRKQKKKDILPHINAFSPCRKARTRGKTNLHRRTSEHGNAVLAEEKHLNRDHKTNLHCRTSEHGNAVLAEEKHLNSDNKMEVVDLVKYFQATGLD